MWGAYFCTWKIDKMLQFCPWMLAPDYYRDLFHCLPEYSEADIWLLCLIWRINLFLYVLDSIFRILGMFFQHTTKVKFTQQTIAALWAKFCVPYVFLLFSALIFDCQTSFITVFLWSVFLIIISSLSHPHIFPSKPSGVPHTGSLWGPQIFSECLDLIFSFPQMKYSTLSSGLSLTSGLP